MVFFLKFRGIVFFGVFFLIIYSTVSCQVSNSVKLDGQYYSIDSLYVIDLIQNGDSLKGNHCFTTYDGAMIDCCLKDDGVSLELVRKGKESFEGILVSCYHDDTYEVRFDVKKDGVLLTVNGGYQFIGEEEQILFTK